MIGELEGARGTAVSPGTVLSGFAAALLFVPPLWFFFSFQNTHVMYEPKLVLLFFGEYFFFIPVMCSILFFSFSIFTSLHSPLLAFVFWGSGTTCFAFLNSSDWGVGGVWAWRFGGFIYF